MPALARIERTETTRLEWLAIALVVITGTIHLVLGLVFLPDPLAIAFVLAAAGFAGALTLFARGVSRRPLYIVGVAFVGAQIVGWLVIAQPTGVGDVGPLEALDKLVQLSLIAILVVLASRES
jgi:hypothetical protein